MLGLQTVLWTLVYCRYLPATEQFKQVWEPCGTSCVTITQQLGACLWTVHVIWPTMKFGNCTTFAGQSAVQTGTVKKAIQFMRGKFFCKMSVQVVQHIWICIHEWRWIWSEKDLKDICTHYAGDIDNKRLLRQLLVFREMCRDTWQADSEHAWCFFTSQNHRCNTSQRV